MPNGSGGAGSKWAGKVRKTEPYTYRFLLLATRGNRILWLAYALARYQPGFEGGGGGRKEGITWRASSFKGNLGEEKQANEGGGVLPKNPCAVVFRINVISRRGPACGRLWARQVSLGKTTKV